MIRGCLAKVAVIFLLILCISTGVMAQESANVSDGRLWGMGIQAGLPYGGLLSVRSWFSPRWGAEGILFVSGDLYFVEGTASARILYRVSDGNVVDFYTAVGATYPLADRTPTFSLLGGIEFGFRLAPSLAWNIEFGAGYNLDGTFSMGLGTGLHYYFPGH